MRATGRGMSTDYTLTRYPDGVTSLTPTNVLGPESLPAALDAAIPPAGPQPDPRSGVRLPTSRALAGGVLLPGARVRSDPGVRGVVIRTEHAGGPRSRHLVYVDWQVPCDAP